ncbi:MAG TPA: SCO1664 family protein [Dermatophilaceae bacterium]|nr:SCO1664 family protein [Dermatophilaceae bacterium]
MREAGGRRPAAVPVLRRAAGPDRPHLPPRQRVQALSWPWPQAQVLDRLAFGSLEVVGRLVDASNLALQCLLRDGGTETLVMYKPVRGERELWDFPDGTLANREAAAYAVSAVGGWDLVPPTVLREGPFGEGTVQLWVDPADQGALIDVVPRRRLRQGWLPVFDAQTFDGTRVVVAHADRPDLLAAAVFDAVVNNADRKGSHLVLDGTGGLRGFDHGLTFHETPKLRTVLWGWAGQPLPAVELARLECLAGWLRDDRTALAATLARLLTRAELAALRRRVDRLVGAGILPDLPSRRPAVPWPPL